MKMPRGRIKRPDDSVTPKFPIVGKVKTGYKDDKGLPRSSDYFIPDSKYSMMFHNAYGAKPDTIHVVFLDDDPGNVCNEYYEFRDKQGRLVASGDGEEFKVWNPGKGKDGEYEHFEIKDHPDLMERIETKNQSINGWEIKLTLRFILPKIPGVVGLWEFTTKGKESSIPQIRDAFDLMLDNRGFVKGIIFDLSVKFAKSQKPGKQSRYPVVSLVPNQSDENVEMIKQGLLKIEDQKLIE